MSLALSVTQSPTDMEGASGRYLPLLQHRQSFPGAAEGIEEFSFASRKLLPYHSRKNEETPKETECESEMRLIFRLCFGHIMTTVWSLSLDAKWTAF